MSSFLKRHGDVDIQSGSMQYLDVFKLGIRTRTLLARLLGDPNRWASPGHRTCHQEAPVESGAGRYSLGGGAIFPDPPRHPGSGCNGRTMADHGRSMRIVLP